MKNVIQHLLILTKLLILGYAVAFILVSVMKGQLVFFNQSFIPVLITLSIIALLNFFSYLRFFGIKPNTLQKTIVTSMHSLDEIIKALKQNLDYSKINVEGNSVTIRTKPKYTWGEIITIEFKKSDKHNNKYEITSKSPLTFVDYGVNYLNIVKVERLINEAG